VEVRDVNRRRRDVALAIGVLGAFLAAAWLDRGRVVHVQQAAIFSAIWAGIQLIAEALGIVGGAIAASLEAVVAYLVTAVAWLAGALATFLASAGAVFAKIWDGLKIVWSDVLKPTLVWMDKAFTRVQVWLKDTFGPVFKWLQRVRDELNAVYNKFVKPVVDTIEFLRQLNRVLVTFHITFLQKLDTTLEQIEQRIEEPILWLNRKLSEVQNAVNFIVTADGFFQRLTLIKSMSHYVPDWVNGFWNSHIDKGALSAALSAPVAEQPRVDVSIYSAELGNYFANGAGAYAALSDAAASACLVAAGVTTT
jgi:hypothetical protein